MTATSPRRTLWLILLMICSLWIGLVGGMALAGRFLVPADSGFAGPAIALGYGAASALVAGALSGWLGLRLSGVVLRRAVLVAALLSALAIAVIAYRVAQQQAVQRSPAPDVTMIDIRSTI